MTSLRALYSSVLISGPASNLISSLFPEGLAHFSSICGKKLKLISRIFVKSVLPTRNLTALILLFKCFEVSKPGYGSGNLDDLDNNTFSQIT